MNTGSNCRHGAQLMSETKKMTKQIDMTVLPNGMLIEVKRSERVWQKHLMCSARRFDAKGGFEIRPTLDYWHFNHGSMRLPDGLVCEFWYADGTTYKFSSTSQNFTHKPQGWIESRYIENLHADCIMAVKILGLHPDYAHEKERLAMEVIELRELWSKRNENKR